MTFTTPAPFSEALAKLAARTVTPSAMDTAAWRGVDAEIRERAFFSARVESARTLQAMKDYLEDYMAGSRMENGGLTAQGRSEFVADMRELAMREGLGRIDPETGMIDPAIRESDLRDIRSCARLQLIFDTQTESAQEYGYWKQGQNPAVLRAFPAQQFIRIRPVLAPRPYHQVAQGSIRRKDDLPFWLSMNRDFNVPWGPWGFNSGMGVEDVDRAEAIAAGVIRPDEVVEAIAKPFNAGLAAGVRNLDGGIPAALARATGGTVAGGSITAREPAAETAPSVPRLPGIMRPVTPPPRKSPASAKITGLEAHPESATLRAVLSVLDASHEDGGLKEVLLAATGGAAEVGSYSYSGLTGEPLLMTVSTASPWPELTLLHEIAHWIDQQIFGGRDGFGTETGKWQTMRKLLTTGETAGEIRRMIRSERSRAGGRRDLYPEMIRSLREMLPPSEMFARAYTQWIAVKSGHPRLEMLLTTADAHRFGVHSLTDADFARFDKEITTQFTQRGWLTNTNH